MAFSSDVEESLTPYLSVRNIIIRLIFNLSTMFFLYGIYTVVFGLSIHVLFRHNTPTCKLYIGWTVVLFTLGTLYTTIETWGLTRQVIIGFNAATTGNYYPLLTGDRKSTTCLSITMIIGTLMNAIADSMLIHRCYIVWNFNRLVLYPLTSVAIILNGMDLGCVIATIIGFKNPAKLATKAQLIDYRVAICMAVFQFVLAFMTGSRIWWIGQEARKLTGISTRKYKAIVAIIIESGLLYASTLLGLVIIRSVVTPGTSSVVSSQLSILMSGLTSTLIIVRVGYGNSINSIQQMISTLQFTNALETTATRRTTIDLPLQSVHSRDSKMEV